MDDLRWPARDGAAGRVGGDMSTLQYVRDTYGVPAQIGRRVIVYGKPGIIAADRGHYIGVTFDTDKPGVIHNAHPTDQVVYGALGPVRPMTPSQRRYQRYLDVADCYENFAHFLRVAT
jgi:hypothetical protein